MDIGESDLCAEGEVRRWGGVHGKPEFGRKDMFVLPSYDEAEKAIGDLAG